MSENKNNRSMFRKKNDSKHQLVELNDRANLPLGSRTDCPQQALSSRRVPPVSRDIILNSVPAPVGLLTAHPIRVFLTFDLERFHRSLIVGPLTGKSPIPFTI
jgi:hypothetical protein